LARYASIAVRGTNLNAQVRPNARLFEGLARHRAAWVSQRLCGREGQVDFAASVDRQS
jgi:hypothetical protein